MSEALRKAGKGGIPSSTQKTEPRDFVNCANPNCKKKIERFMWWGSVTTSGGVHGGVCSKSCQEQFNKLPRPQPPVHRGIPLTHGQASSGSD